jgi:hypothetical protein
MSDDKKDGAGKLDLGITALLGNQGSAALSESTTETPEAVRATAVLTLDEDNVDFNRELTSLAEQRQWGVLVSRAESAIGSDEDLEARLWWIRGHLGGFSLPVSLLAAPFETVCRQLVGDARLDVYRQLVHEIGEMVLNRLHDVGDRRQEQSVRDAMMELGVLDSKGRIEPVWNKVPPRAPRFELGDARQEQQDDVVVSTETVKKSGAFKRPVLLLAIFILAALAGAVWSWRSLLREPEVALASESLVQVAEAAGALKMPVVASRPVSGKLGVYYSLSETPTGDKPAVEQRSAAAVPAARVDSVDTEPRPPRPEPSAGTPREQVKTDGPIEGAEFKRGIEKRTNPGGAADIARIPDPLPKPSVQDDRRGSSYPDGSVVLAGEVKSVVVDTDVFDKAGFQGVVIAHLQRGDQVNIEGRVGPWLRIRSRKGRVGFVFAQDIGEIEEFNVQSPEPEARQ